MGHVVYRIKTRKPGKKQKGRVYLFNHFMYAVACIAPVLTLPQVWEVWINHQVGGISVITWAAYAITSFLWLIYGIINHEKPIIFSQIPMLCLDIAIVAGISLVH